MVREFLCTSVRRDLPPEIDIIRELLSFCENFKISLRPCTQEERDKVFSFIFKTHECYVHLCEFREVFMPLAMTMSPFIF